MRPPGSTLCQTFETVAHDHLVSDLRAARSRSRAIVSSLAICVRATCLELKAQRFRSIQSCRLFSETSIAAARRSSARPSVADLQVASADSCEKLHENIGDDFG
jgi:hypothetical protein